MRGALNAVGSLSAAQRGQGGSPTPAETTAGGTGVGCPFVRHPGRRRHARHLARYQGRSDAGTRCREIVVVFQRPIMTRVATIAAERGLLVIPPCDHADVIAGQGTVGLEIVQDVPDIGTVLVPVGGGGLISGVAIAVKAISPATRVVGVEPELAGDLAEGFRRGERAIWDPALTGRTIADGVRLLAVGELTRQHITRPWSTTSLPCPNRASSTPWPFSPGRAGWSPSRVAPPTTAVYLQRAGAFFDPAGQSPSCLEATPNWRYRRGP